MRDEYALIWLSFWCLISPKNQAFPSSKLPFPKQAVLILGGLCWPLVVSRLRAVLYTLVTVWVSFSSLNVDRVLVLESWTTARRVQLAVCFEAALCDFVLPILSRAAYNRLRLRPRVLRDVSSVDTTRVVLGARMAHPIGISPTGDVVICDGAHMVED